MVQSVRDTLAPRSMLPTSTSALLHSLFKYRKREEEE